MAAGAGDPGSDPGDRNGRDPFRPSPGPRTAGAEAGTAGEFPEADEGCERFLPQTQDPGWMHPVRRGADPTAESFYGAVLVSGTKALSIVSVDEQQCRDPAGKKAH